MSVRDTIRSIKPTVVSYTLLDGRVVWVRSFNGKGRARYMSYVETAKANGGIKAEVIAAMAICEENGALAYDYQKQADLDELAEMIDGQDLDGIGMKLFEVSGLAKGSVEDAAKNSEASPNSCSGSSSQPTSSTAQ